MSTGRISRKCVRIIQKTNKLVLKYNLQSDMCFYLSATNLKNGLFLKVIDSLRMLKQKRMAGPVFHQRHGLRQFLKMESSRRLHPYRSQLYPYRNPFLAITLQLPKIEDGLWRTQKDAKTPKTKNKAASATYRRKQHQRSSGEGNGRAPKDNLRRMQKSIQDKKI
ncbi:hypothetical protein AVEN_132980-1 [Araneus ventricosus]|uniref:Uncharacterized protein n=1 Tax=Araneus ventricosus TaxID=182803 RepID=A0A4Y2M468_ARAVE|nr:hypothetical protein AVEN_132980-1 [Araneus ventricosus]